MRRARVSAGGRVHDVTVRDDGMLAASGRVFEPDAVQWLPPTDPRTVVGLALTFKEHAAELGLEAPQQPVLFLKPPGSLIGHRAPVVAPSGVEYMHYEVELAVVIGKPARRIRASHARDVIAGYTIANDVTVRDFVANMYRPPVKAKGWDTFGPVGPWIEDEIEEPENLRLRAFVNNELRQEGHTADLRWSVGEIVEVITFFMTLAPGDLILTGTPPGISHVYPGDVMRLEIEKIGALENPVVTEDLSPDR